MVKSQGRRRCVAGSLAFVVILGLASVVPAAAGVRQSTPPGAAQNNPNAPRPPSPAEVQAIVDGWVIVQAQTALGLSDEQFPQFVMRWRAFQETRRRNQRAHIQLIQELWRMTNPKNPPGEESQLRDKLKALDDLDAKSASDLQKAYDAVDQVLDVRQQARFRVFLDQVERRMLELLTKARGQGPAAAVPGRGRGGRRH